MWLLPDITKKPVVKDEESQQKISIKYIYGPGYIGFDWNKVSPMQAYVMCGV